MSTNHLVTPTDVTSQRQGNDSLDGAPVGPARSLQLVGGAAMLAAPLLMAGGAATSPPQDGSGEAAYISSLADDYFLTAVSANLLHYAWVLFAIGGIISIGLVRGRRGRVLSVVGGLLGSFGAIQISGLLLNDWFLAALGNNVSIDQAVHIFDITTTTSIDLWVISGELLSTLGFTVLFAGLARAGVISWWLVPPSLVFMLVFFMVPGPLGLAIGLACCAASFVTGFRLVQRAQADS